MEIKRNAPSLQGFRVSILLLAIRLELPLPFHQPLKPAQRARELLELARGLVSEPVESSDRLVAAGLSEREAEVSRLVVEGHTYKEIGAVLYISPKTVEHHVARIRQRLGVTSRAELLATVRELLSS